MTRPCNLWLTTELNLLRELWPVHGIACAPQFPRHTAHSVRRRAGMLGLSSPQADSKGRIRNREQAVARVRHLMQVYKLTAAEVA